jgi:hypothetical protein
MQVSQEIRRQVFMEEQEIRQESDIDGQDLSEVHIS